MDQPLFILFVVAVVALVLVGAYFSHLQEKKRREALAGLAGELGWQFYPDRDGSHDEQYAHFAVFRRGHSRAAYNTLQGSVQANGTTYPCKMGDFTYKVTSGSGKNRSTHTYHFSYLITHLPYPHVPALLIRPEGMFDKLAGALGWDDIDFESVEFSRQFYVRSSDKRFAYDVLHPRMIEFLLATNPPAIDIEQSCCCIATDGRRWEPEQFRQQLGWAQQFLALWPDHVKADLTR